ncbi:bacteriohemerythrin [Crassaminicella profunda]|uniref:bacteriohemerythrin n=1 Tax=Crassaminicella profunda TaxID=1286698 RepID=UPI001CA654F6|nr:bacteriohemerythrin [Crassaminicella profunda]QZY54985.1 bacteriohemerythrin [Crassaminicella profunda]
MFEWKEEFEVNVKALDDQHKKLFQIGEEIFQTMKSDKLDKYDDIMKLVYELHNYTAYHFNDEERIAKENGIPLSQKHLEQHKAFLLKLMEVKTIDIDENQRDFLIDILGFVADWIANHILKTDKEYSVPLNEKGIY